nr:hypothetical protein [Clostridium paraputrificum]
MKKVFLTVFLLASLILFIITIFNFFSKPKFYKESNQDNITDESNSVGEQECLDYGENKNNDDYKINLSDKEKNNTKQAGKEFVELIHGYSLDNSHKDQVMKATEFATESMKSFIIGTFINSKQPILYEGFYARVVDRVEPVEFKIYEDSIMWEYNVYSNIINKEGELINKESNIVNLLFVKENNEWRVGEYSTTQYRG